MTKKFIFSRTSGRLSGIRQNFWPDIRYPAELLAGNPAKSVSATTLTKMCIYLFSIFQEDIARFEPEISVRVVEGPEVKTEGSGQQVNKQ